MTALYILIAILAFGFLILIHEFGHYLMARLFKVKIYEFSIGMGPVIIKKVSKKTGIQYSLRLLPMGGYVSMAGETSPDDKPNTLIPTDNSQSSVIQNGDEQNSENGDNNTENAVDEGSLLCNKKKWQRLLVFLAGPFVNLVFGFLAMILLTSIFSLSSLAKNPDHPPFATNTVAEFVENASSNSDAGLRVGDTVMKVGHARIHTGDDLRYEISMQGYDPVDVTVIRGGKTVVLKDVVFPSAEQNGISLGQSDFYVYGEYPSFGIVMKYSFFRSISFVKTVFDSLKGMITGRFAVKDMSGPVGITEVMTESMKQSGGALEAVLSLLNILSLISINLGVMNLLPLPILDGGQILFLGIEAVMGRPVKAEARGILNLICTVLFLGLFVFITFSDVTKLFS